jgi:hypothetical protein
MQPPAERAKVPALYEANTFVPFLFRVLRAQEIT